MRKEVVKKMAEAEAYLKPGNCFLKSDCFFKNPSPH